MRRVFATLCLGFVVTAASATTLISKPPDIGSWWHPVGNNSGGSWVYADSFIAPQGDTVVAELGTWLEAFDYYGGPQHSEVAFQIWGGGDAGPNFNQVIASTDDFSTEDPNLTLYMLPVTSGPAVLTPGERYWFVLNGANRGNPTWDDYRTGGHTQNSVYNDNGTFWYSNDQNGQNFDGQGLTPEMAFQVGLVPEPVSFIGLLALALIRRR